MWQLWYKAWAVWYDEGTGQHTVAYESDGTQETMDVGKEPLEWDAATVELLLEVCSFIHQTPSSLSLSPSLCLSVVSARSRSTGVRETCQIAPLNLFILSCRRKNARGSECGRSEFPPGSDGHAYVSAIVPVVVLGP